MKRINLITVFYIVQLIFVIVQASPLRQELHEGWIYRQARGINWYTAEVPGTIHTDLINSELIDDPFYRLNEKIKRTGFTALLLMWINSYLINPIL